MYYNPNRKIKGAQYACASLTEGKQKEKQEEIVKEEEKTKEEENEE